MSVDEENSNSNGLEKPCNPDRSREWFGVQLEVSKNAFENVKFYSGKFEEEKKRGGGKERRKKN